MIDKILEELRLFRDHPAQMEYRDIARQYALQLDGHLIRPDGDYGEMRPTMLYEGIPCFPRQDLIAITGKAKCGKTWASSILMAAAMWGGEILGMEAAVGQLKVLYVDTEQAAYSTQKVLDRVLQMSTLPYNSERLQMLNLRRESHEIRLSLLLAATSRMQPDIIIIDGVRDLLLDFNNIDESMTLINRLMKLATDFDCAVVCILHQNKPKDDNNMRGHLGTELENKAAEVYELSREDNIFCFTQKLSRNQPLEHDLRFEIKGERPTPERPSPESPTPTLPREGEGKLPKPVTQSVDKADWEKLDHFEQLVIVTAFHPDLILTYNDAMSRFWKCCKGHKIDAKEIWQKGRKAHCIVGLGNNRFRLSEGATYLPPQEGQLTP